MLKFVFSFSIYTAIGIDKIIDSAKLTVPGCGGHSLHD